MVTVRPRFQYLCDSDYLLLKKAMQLHKASFSCTIRGNEKNNTQLWRKVPNGVRILCCSWNKYSHIRKIR